MRVRLAALGALAVMSSALVAADAAWAHHSTTIYDLRTKLELKGTVKEFHWTQPHSFVVLVVETPGEPAVEWNVEVGSPSVNVQFGWKKSDIKAGDVIEMTVHPVRTGEKHGTASIVKLADGRTLYTPAAALAGVLPRN